MKQATVEFRHVSKHYGAQGAVVDLSLLVPAGDICVLVGPSGCGKTTSLKMVNRLVEPSSGQVLIDGQDVMSVEVTQLRRGIGYVIQQVGLFPHQTIAENIATVPRLLGWPKKDIQRRTEELLDLVGLDPARVRNRYPSQLSGGERQRVGVARAMAAEPPVMLMDEPFGAVDPIVRERLQNVFLRLHRALGTTVLFVTHDIDEAIKMGTRVAVMQQGGHLAQYAPPTELLAQPASDFVSRFVGADIPQLRDYRLWRIEQGEAEMVAT
jgi:osmoprotectant transport system ATP-binding protein